MANLAKKALLGETLGTIELEPEENTSNTNSVLDIIRKEEVYENMEDIKEVPNTQETSEETKVENTEVPSQEEVPVTEETEEPEEEKEVPIKEEPKPKQTTSRRSRRASPKTSRTKSSSNIVQGDDLVTSIQLNIINQCREVFEKTQDNSELLSPIWDDIIRKIKGEN